MPTTTNSITMPAGPAAPSRRALFGAGAALLAGGALSDPAFVKPKPLAWRNGPRPPDEADAELIRICDRITVVEGEIASLFDIATDEDERDVLLEPLNVELTSLVDKYWELPEAVSVAGVRSIARAAWAMAPKRPDGEVEFPGGDAETLAFHVIKHLVAGGAA